MLAAEVFTNWIDECDSAHTKKSYKRIGEQFFLMVFGKSINEIDASDIAPLNSIMFNKKYKKPLLDSGAKDSTLIYWTGL